jgi:hypothetical protein
MGLLQTLGLRGDPSSTFSKWLGDELSRLASETDSGTSETLPRLIAEIEVRVDDFVLDHGARALESAIDQWVDRTDCADVIWATRVFKRMQEERVILRRNLVEAGGERHEVGDSNLASALERTGVLPVHQIFEGLPTVPNPERALTWIWDAVWPFGMMDEAMREKLAAAANISADDAGWHLLGLRYMLLVQASHAAKPAPDRVSELVGYVMSQIHNRLIGRPGFRGTEHAEARFREAATAYLKSFREPARIDGVEIAPVMTTVFGRTFAAECGAPGNIDVRWACAREVAFLYPLLTAYATAWFERN